jgi:CRP-like cAMP-binding protein
MMPPMGSTLAEVFSRAETDFAGGRYEDALRGYVAVITAAPRFTRARYRVADALLNLGDRQRAKEVYKGLAWHYIKAGHPLLGLVVCKMVLALDPGYKDLLYILAELYSSESDRVADVDLPEPLPLPDGAPAPNVANLNTPTLLETAAKLAADTDQITEVPPRFPVIPLFSHLTEEAFIKVLGSLRLRRHTNGQRIITEGEVGDSFFMLADGVVVVTKRLSSVDTVLAHLHQGAVFGEMALVSNAPRAATVTAMGDVDLLELSRRDLEVHAGELESVTQALKKFTRGRFLANLAATSPLFKPLDKADRRVLMAKFKPKVVYANDILIEQGEPGRGLYLVLRGEYKVTRRQDGEVVTLATLRGGDVFGEISLLKETPTTATVTATAVGEVLKLEKEEFNEMLSKYPDVKSTLHDLSEQRLRSNEATRVSTDIITDDSKLII